MNFAESEAKPCSFSIFGMGKAFNTILVMWLMNSREGPKIVNLVNKIMSRTFLVSQ